MRKIITSFNTQIKECKDIKKCDKCGNIIVKEKDICIKCKNMELRKNGD